MRTAARFFGCLVSSLVCLPVILAQTNPPPPDPHEMVTREPRTLSKSDDRAIAIDLLDRARKNYNLHTIGAPYALKVSFETSGAALSEGSGTMEELYDNHSHWRWTEQLGDSRVVRIGADDHIYGANPSDPVPLRVQLVRSVLLRPIVENPAPFIIRYANIEHDGKPLTCLLLSHSLPPNPAPRAWAEREDCFDPATGLLQTWSEAPGIFAVYDYTGATEFHGHTLPHQISVFEEGRLAVEVRVESLEDAPNLDPTLFKPTPEMVDAGESFALASPHRTSLRVDPSDAPTSRFFQPVIVHATLDAQDGTVIDAEALQTTDPGLSRAAIDVIRSTSFDATGFQQEVFFNVQFHYPAARFGGPPIIHPTSVRWVILDHHGSPPVHKPPSHPVH
jgi:hypothetical protein